MSKNFSIRELTRSQTADDHKISNMPPVYVLSNLHQLMAGLERVRAYLGYPLEVLSAYRCPDLNKIVGGALSSQHVDGLAADIHCPGFGDSVRVAKSLSLCMQILGIDQLILEETWVHVSFTIEPRYEALSYRPAKGAAAAYYVSGVIPDATSLVPG